MLIVIECDSDIDTGVAVTGGLSELGLGSGTGQSPQQQQQHALQDLFGAPAPSPVANGPAQPSLPVLLAAEQAKGLTLRGQITRMDGRIGMFQALCTTTRS